MEKIIIPIVNTGIGDFIMTLPLLKNIEKNPALQPLLILNKQVYKDIFDYSFLQKNRFKVIINSNVSDLKFWIDLRRQSKIIISPTVGLKPLILWNMLFFRVYSKPLIWKNKFYIFGLKTFGIPKDHDVINNIKILERFYKDYPGLATETEIYNPKLIVENVKKEKIIFIHPGFDGNSKIPRDWGTENWSELIKRLSDTKKDYMIKIIIGPGWESRFKDYYFDLEKKINNVKIIYKLNLRRLIKELAKGEVLINADSGVGHLAGALGLKIFSIFGPADEKQTGVFSDNTIIIRTAGSSPCYSQGIWIRRCEDKGGLDKIKVEEVLKYVLKN